MTSQVLMKRELFGSIIKQNNQTHFFSATDLVKAGNKWRAINGYSNYSVNDYFRTQKASEFIKELSSKYGEVYKMAVNKSQDTWVHPLLFIDMALSISPALKVEVYEWIMDNLIKFRNDSGDSYKKMCGALYQNYDSPSTFYKHIQDTAIKIQKACQVKDWQEATEQQLELRDKIHDNIALLCNVVKNNDVCVDMGIQKALEKIQLKLKQ